jgi:2-iminobutanoate/2-iminopropanoate deaminase
MPGWTRVVAHGVPEFPAFAHAAIAGDTIYVAGMLGLTEDFSRPVDGGIAPQTTQALRFVERILAECGAALADVVKVTVYMTDLAEWEAMNRAYLEVFGPHTPARIAVGCASLLFGAKVEFDCIAHRAP